MMKCSAQRKTEAEAAWQQGRKDLFYPYGKTYVQTLGEQD
jgi:hypothetical protein